MVVTSKEQAAKILIYQLWASLFLFSVLILNLTGGRSLDSLHTSGLDKTQNSFRVPRVYNCIYQGNSIRRNNTMIT